MKLSEHPAPELKALWQKTPHANLVRYDPWKTYFARIRVSGKLIRQSLRTKVLSVARLRLTDMEKAERQATGSASAADSGKMAFADTLRIYRERLHGNGALKPRTKQYGFPAVSGGIRIAASGACRR